MPALHFHQLVQHIFFYIQILSMTFTGLENHIGLCSFVQNSKYFGIRGYIMT